MNQMREEASHAQSRITTLVNLKDQIVKQRKARIFQQSALKGRALNIKNIPTGPGQYFSPPCTIFKNWIYMITKLPMTSYHDHHIRALSRPRHRSRVVPVFGVWHWHRLLTARC